MKINNARNVTITRNILPSLSVTNSHNVEAYDNIIGGNSPAANNSHEEPDRQKRKRGKGKVYLPLARGPRTGVESRYAPAICTSHDCQHPYLSDIEMLQSTKVTISRNRVKDCPLCGSHGYTLDGVYNQIAEEFTALLFDGINKDQLEAMERIVGLAIVTKDYEAAKASLIEVNPKWNTFWRKLGKVDMGQALLLLFAFIPSAKIVLDWMPIGDHEKEEKTIEYHDYSINYFCSSDFEQKKTDLLSSRLPPKSEKPSKQK